MNRHAITLTLLVLTLLLALGTSDSLAQTTVPVYVNVTSSSGSGLSGVTVRYGTGGSYTTSYFDGSPTGSTGTLTAELAPGTYSFQASINNGHAEVLSVVVGAPGPVTVNFNTLKVTLRLETCGGTPLNGGNPRFGAGSTYTTSWWPGSTTGSSGTDGETYGELFPGTYSFGMNYQGTEEAKLNIAIPSGSPIIWKTTNVTLQYSGQISYGGSTGDATWFSQTPGQSSKELMPGTYKFHFRNDGTYDLTFSGCSFYFNGNPAANVGVETAPDGSGTVVPSQSIVSGNSIVVYAITRDASDNFVSNVAADAWWLENKTGSVADGDLVPSTDGRSATFTGQAAGTAGIKATSGSLLTTNSGTLTVVLPCTAPVVAANPNDQTVCDGSSVSFGSSASGSPPPTVQWQVSTDGGTTWANMVGEATSPLTFTTSASQNANQYRAVFTNTCGSCTTQVATLTVNSAKIYIYSALHTTGTGSKPPSKKTALPVVLEVFSKVGSMDPKDFGTTWNGSENLATDVAISDGGTVAYGGGEANLYTICVPAGGSYLVIGKASVDGQDVYIGSPTDVLAAGSTTKKYLQVIKNGAGKVIPATTTEVPGSLLLIAEPAYLEFTSDQELLPIVYESVDGVWDAMVQADPPEGFVSNPGALSTEVIDSTLKVVQFTIKDIGSSWTSTKVTHHLKHKGKDIKITSSMKMVNKRHKKGAGILAAGENDARTSVDLKFVPTEYALYQNYPDPFNPSTTLQFDLPEPAVVTMRVYNTLGQEVANLLDHVAYEPGKHAIKFDASRLSSGVYIYQLIAGRYVDTKKMLLLK
jgi:hypothetical protein